MKNLKLLLLALMLFSTVLSKAQYNEIKTNALGLILGQYGLSYERVLGEETSVKIDVQYFTPLADDAIYTAFAVVPEFRYFFSPDYDADGWFVGGYLKYRYTVQEDGYYIQDPNTFTGEYRDVRTSGLAIGFSTGRKWVSRSGFVFELNAGLGRFLFENETVEGVENPSTESIFNALPNIDARLGVIFGYRF